MARGRWPRHQQVQPLPRVAALLPGKLKSRDGVKTGSAGLRRAHSSLPADEDAGMDGPAEDIALHARQRGHPPRLFLGPGDAERDRAMTGAAEAPTRRQARRGAERAQRIAAEERVSSEPGNTRWRVSQGSGEPAAQRTCSRTSVPRQEPHHGQGTRAARASRRRPARAQ